MYVIRHYYVAVNMNQFILYKPLKTFYYDHLHLVIPKQMFPVLNY